MNGCKFTIDDKHPFDQGHMKLWVQPMKIFINLKTNDILLLTMVGN